MSTVVQAVSMENTLRSNCGSNLTSLKKTEHLIIESATEVVTQVAKSNSGDLKTIESSVVKEAVSATKENAPNLRDKVQDGVSDVATEVVKGAQSAVKAVEQHPELIAE
jgi:gas vesicle protein